MAAFSVAKHQLGKSLMESPKFRVHPSSEIRTPVRIDFRRKFDEQDGHSTGC